MLSEGWEKLLNAWKIIKDDLFADKKELQWHSN